MATITRLSGNRASNVGVRLQGRSHRHICGAQRGCCLDLVFKLRLSHALELELELERPGPKSDLISITWLLSI